MEKHLFYCPCNLKHQISIDACLVGRKFPIRILGKYDGFVLFPIFVKDEEDGFKLTNPRIDGVTGDYECTVYDCGSYFKSHNRERKEFLHPRINYLFFTLEVGTSIDDDYSIRNSILEEIQQFVSKFIKCISLIHEESITWSFTKDIYVDPINFSLIRNSVSGKACPLIEIAPFSFKSHELSVKEFFYIYKNITKELSLQHELLADVERAFVRCEHREVILNCATIIEKTLRDQVIEYLEQKQTDDKIIFHIRKTLDGFSKIKKAMRNLSLPLNGINEIESGTINLRNRIIHGGYIPNKEEAEKAIVDAKDIIKQYNVSLFIE